MDYNKEWDKLYEHVKGAVIEGLQRYFDEEPDGVEGSEVHGQFLIFKDIYDRMTVAEFGETIDLHNEAYDFGFEDWCNNGWLSDFDDDNDLWYDEDEDEDEDITERDSEVD